MKKLCVFLFCIIFTALPLFSCSVSQSPPETEQPPLLFSADLDYTNHLGQKFLFRSPSEGATIYTKRLSELNREKHENIALTDEMYLQDQTYILTEGRIESITKVQSENQVYRVDLIEYPDLQKQLKETLHVFFFGETIESLLSTVVPINKDIDESLSH